MIGRIKNMIFNSSVYSTYTSSKVKGKTKIFVIGRNKTGTTSLHDEFLRRRYIVGNQHRGELLVDAYISKDYDSIVNYCKTAQVFQDAPFSFPETYKELDKAYPDSKFILTVRDTPKDWYRSITSFHSKLFGKGSLPTKENLLNAGYVYKGWIWKVNRALYNSPESNPYQEDILVESYNKYNQEVQDYFAGTDKLLVLNLSNAQAYNKFCTFLDIETEGKSSFPWSNKTKDITIK